MYQDAISSLAATGTDCANLFKPQNVSPVHKKRKLQQNGELIPDLDVPFASLPKIMSAFLYLDDQRKQLILLYNEAKVVYSKNFPTLFAEVTPRQSVKHTVFAALEHVSFIVYVFRYRRPIIQEPTTKNSIVTNTEMNIHTTPDTILDHVKSVCTHYFREHAKPNILVVFLACIRYKTKDFLSDDGTLIILQSTTLQMLIEISRYVEKITGQKFSSIFFSSKSSESQQIYNANKLRQFHCELEFIESPTKYEEEFKI